MDEKLFEKGLQKRKATLGKDYVEKNLAKADDFTRPFQEAMTAWCWGFGWGDETIDAKTRSMMNLSMIGALGKMDEWEIHCRGAITNGVSKEEIREQKLDIESQIHGNVSKDKEYDNQNVRKSIENKKLEKTKEASATKEVPERTSDVEEASKEGEAVEK